ncbi:MAG: ATP-binding protein [Campylobacterales bacterium]|nr:ATP-binding protein [Campylobacterales bacterium]
MNFKFSVKNKVFILFVAVIVISLSIVGWYGFKSAKDSYINSALLLNNSQTKALSTQIEGLLETVPDDVFYNAGLSSLGQLIIWQELGESTKVAYWKKIYVSALKDYLSHKKLYYKIRLLDTNGIEKIALSYNKTTGTVVQVNDEELQNQSDKEYFKEAMKLKEDQFYISALDLNTEYGKITQPNIPVLRYSTPIVDENAQIKGVLVVSLNAERFLSIIGSEFKKFHLIDHEGEYLYTEDKTKKWGKELGTDTNFKKDYPNIIEQFKDKDAVSFKKNGKIFSMQRIYPEPLIHKDVFWYLVSEVDENVAFSALNEFILIFFLILGGVLAIGLLVVNGYISKLMTPLTRITTQLKALSRGEIQKENIHYEEEDEIGEIVSSTTILIEAIETTIHQANAVAKGDFTKDIKLLGANDKLGLALRGMTKRLKEISSLATKLSQGNYNVLVLANGSEDELGLALIEMIQYLKQITMVAESIAHGELDVLYKKQGSEDRLGIAILEMIQYLKSILEQAKAISKEDFTHAIEVKSNKDELGLAIVTMTDILKVNSIKTKEDTYFNEGIAEFNDKLTGFVSIPELSTEAITAMSRYAGASSGVVYTFDKNKSQLKLMATFAFSAVEKLANTIALGEGVIGQVALEKIPMLLQNVKESEFIIQSATTYTQAKEVYIFPLLFEGNLLGVVELIHLNAFQTIEKEYLTKAASIFATALNTTGQNAEIKILLEKSQQAYEELQVQSEELEESNVQMVEQQQQLSVQSKELQEKNKILAEAKEEIDKRAHDLEIASKYKSEFLANMSHELRTPLNSIILLSKLLSVNSNNKLDEESVKKVSVINRAGNDLLLLINDILDLTKIESGKMELDVSEIYSGDILNEMKGLFSALSEEKGVAFILNDDFKSTFITDKTKLSQVLKNFLSNAFKFTKQGSVSVNISATNSVLVMSVKDTGIGIANDKIDAIFDAFKQVDGSISREFGGTGLGLSISKTLVELLGGHIRVASELGKGTEFIFTLPLSREDSSPKVEVLVQKSEIKSVTTNPLELISILSDDDSHFSGNELQNKNILIVDDDSRNIFTLTSVLEDLKAEVYSAFDGKEAIEVLENESKIDIILMDIMMPVMDGLSAIKNIKSNEKFKNIPIIAITAKSMPQDKQECLDAGANDYLSKPLEHNALISLIKAWVK